MSPHWNKHTKTKEGYIMAIEARLFLDNNLPKEFYRLPIDDAAELYNATVTSGRAGFEMYAKILELKTEGIFKNDN